jgi:hypothetical protein
VLKALTFICFAANSTTVSWRIVEINTGTETSAAFKFAAATTLWQGIGNNAAVAVVTSIQLGINRIYIETDY